MTLSVWTSNIPGYSRRIFAAMLPLIMSMLACNKTPVTATAKQAISQKTFSSPSEAGAALLQAASSGDKATLQAVFGPDAATVFLSGDPVKDKDTLQGIAAAFNQMNRWGKIKAGGEVLYIGADNYPFPIPLDRNSSGQWYFDTPAGKDEILARRIGNGELTAIAACAAIADAQQKYFNQTHDNETIKQFAQTIVSVEGKQNGLYWPVSGDQVPSPLARLGDFAKAAGYANANGKPQPFNGYYFRILTRQGAMSRGGAKDYIVNGKMTGGFAILAYPAQYKNSGIMTFIIDKDGFVYQKDLGESTAAAAEAITEYNPGDGWDIAVGT